MIRLDSSSLDQSSFQMQKPVELEQQPASHPLQELWENVFDEKEGTAAYFEKVETLTNHAKALYASDLNCSDYVRNTIVVADEILQTKQTSDLKKHSHSPSPSGSSAKRRRTEDSSVSFSRKMQELGMISHNVVGDGNCGPRALAVSDALTRGEKPAPGENRHAFLRRMEDKHETFREKTVKEMRRQKDMTLMEITQKEKNKDWFELDTFRYAASSDQKPILIFTKDPYSKQIVSFLYTNPYWKQSGPEHMRMVYLNGNHFHALHSEDLQVRRTLMAQAEEICVA